MGTEGRSATSGGGVIRPVRIVSGGQSGADRGALEAARQLLIPIGGWCPQGGWAEDLPDPPGVMALFPELREAGSPEPEVRTRANVRDSDTTLILVPSAGLAASPGTLLTRSTAREMGRPLLVLDPDDPATPSQVRHHLASLSTPAVLNVAGPRESESPGLTEAARRCLLEALGNPAVRGANG